MTRRKEAGAVDAGPTVMAPGRGGDSLTPAPNFDNAAALIQDVERRYLSAVWHDPFGGFNAAVDTGLTGASFSSAEHRAVYCTLAARAEAFAVGGPLWTVAVVRRVVVGLGVELVAGDGGDELGRILNSESSGAGASSYARCIAFYIHKRRQVRRLHRALRDVPGDVLTFGTQANERPVVLVRSVRRKRGAA